MELGLAELCVVGCGYAALLLMLNVARNMGRLGIMLGRRTLTLDVVRNMLATWSLNILFIL